VPATIIYITGGERSGKSRYALERAQKESPTPVYLATAKHWDADFTARITRHQHERDERWTTLEEERLLSAHNLAGKVVVVDCITLWLTNWYTFCAYDVDKTLAEAKAELARLFMQDTMLIIISNEIGMGLHAETAMGRKFVELQGWINQYIAIKAHQAYFMVSGLPLRLT